MKIKLVLKYIVEFILSITLFSFVFLLILKATVFNESYFINQLKENNYYQLLSERIRENMSYYIIQSGLEEEVLDNIFSIKDVEENVNIVVASLYNGNGIILKTNTVRENLENNIDAYLLNNKKEVSDRDSLDAFVDTMMSVYEESITLHNGFDYVAGPFYKISKVLPIFLVVSFVAIVLETLWLVYLLQCKRIAVPLMTSGILLLLSNILVKTSIDIKNIVFYNEEVATIIKEMSFGVLNWMTNAGILLFVLGICLAIWKTANIKGYKK